MIPWLDTRPDAPFPPVEQALVRPDGLLAAGGDLSVTRLLRAYSNGIFPWYSEGQPILWWSPNPRCVLFCERVHLARRLARRMRSRSWRISMDADFATVVEACAEPRPGQPETWITPAMREAYLALHRAGYAHSLEIRTEDGQLAGGVYGVAIGRVFFGESMFHRVDDGSKIALVALCRQLADWGFPLMDCQIYSEHLERMGAEMIARPRFVELLEYTRLPGPSRWRFSLPWEAVIEHR